MAGGTFFLRLGKNKRFVTTLAIKQFVLANQSKICGVVVE
jgi:hypothetical protein